MLIPFHTAFLAAEPSDLQPLIDRWSDEVDKTLAVLELARADDRQATVNLVQAQQKGDEEATAIAYHKWLSARNDWRRAGRRHWEALSTLTSLLVKKECS